MVGVGQQRELIEQPRIAGDFDPLDGRQPRQRLFERSRVLQLLFRGEGIGIGMAARVRRPRQISVDVREARLAIARQVAQPVLRRRHGLRTSSRRRATNGGISTSSGVRSSASRDRSLPKLSLPLARDRGTARNSPSSAGDNQASSGGDRNQTITAVTQLKSMCRLW